MTDYDELMSRVKFGIEIDSFVNSGTGKYLLERAGQEVAQAVEGLKNVDPDDSKQIRDLQNQVFRAESINRWLAEAIEDGYQSELILKGEL